MDGWMDLRVVDGLNATGVSAVGVGGVVCCLIAAFCAEQDDSCCYQQPFHLGMGTATAATAATATWA